VRSISLENKMGMMTITQTVLIVRKQEYIAIGVDVMKTNANARKTVEK